MTLGEIRTELKKRLGNIQTSDIWAAHVSDWINRGIGDVIIAAIQKSDNFSLFPELLVSWDTSAATTNGDASLDVPATKYTITGAASYDKVTTPSRHTDKSNPMSRVSPQDFDLLDKTATGYPRLWMWEANLIWIWPTPSNSPTNYLTFLSMYGLDRETQFTAATADAQALKLNEVWHGAVVAKSAFHGAQARGWFQRADEYAKECDQLIARAASVSAISVMNEPVCVELAEPLTRGRIYGY